MVRSYETQGVGLASNLAVEGAPPSPKQTPEEGNGRERLEKERKYECREMDPITFIRGTQLYYLKRDLCTLHYQRRKLREPVDN